MTVYQDLLIIQYASIALMQDDRATVTQQSRQQAFETFATTDDHCIAIIGMAHDDSGKRYYIESVPAYARNLDDKQIITVYKNGEELFGKNTQYDSSEEALDVGKGEDWSFTFG